MKAEHHAILSLLTAGGAYGLTRSVGLSAGLLAGGVLIDVDHLFDYFMEYGLRLDFRHFFTACYTRRLRHAYLLLHAWEWVLALSVAVVLTGWPPWLAGLTVGWGAHMLLDQFVNRPTALGYSIIYRVAFRFAFLRAFPE